MGAGGGGGGENGLKCPHYLIDYEGGWRMNLEFCRYIWIFVVTLEFRPYIYANKGHYCTAKILVIYQVEYGEELRVSDPKLRNFRLAWLN